MKSEFRIVLVDTNPETQAAAQKAISSLSGRWKLEGYTTTQQALRLIPPAPPDLVLIENQLPDIPGVDCIRRLKAMVDTLRIVMLSTQARADEIFRFLLAGASGHLAKPVQVPALAQAIERAVQGLPVLCEKTQASIVTCLQNAGKRTLAELLTPREQQILPLLFEHLSNKEIAEVLKIAPGTVHVHLTHLFQKLRVHTRQDAIRRLIDPV